LIGIKQQLSRAGIDNKDISEDWLRAISAAMTKWLLTTDDGIRYAARLFHLDIKQGDNDKEYTLVDNELRTAHTIKNTSVWFLSGVIVNGRPVPIVDPHRNGHLPKYELEIEDSTKNKCDSCGIVSHCLKEILEPYSEQLQSLCNYCLTHHEHTKVKDVGGIGNCHKCSVVNCKNKPVEVLKLG